MKYSLLWSSFVCGNRVLGPAVCKMKAKDPTAVSAPCLSLHNERHQSRISSFVCLCWELGNIISISCVPLHWDLPHHFLWGVQGWSCGYMCRQICRKNKSSLELHRYIQYMCVYTLNFFSGLGQTRLSSWGTPWYLNQVLVLSVWAGEVCLELKTINSTKLVSTRKHKDLKHVLVDAAFNTRR